MARISVPSRRWGVLALAVVPIFLLAGCGSSDPYPAASSAVSSTCSDLDNFDLNQTTSPSELNNVLQEAKTSGDPVLESGARAYRAAASAHNQSAKNGAMTKMLGRCLDIGLGPNQSQ